MHAATDAAWPRGDHVRGPRPDGFSCGNPGEVDIGILRSTGTTYVIVLFLRMIFEFEFHVVMLERSYYCCMAALITAEHYFLYDMTKAHGSSVFLSLCSVWRRREGRGGE